MVSLISFFVTAFSFAINCALEITFEMISPLGDDDVTDQTFYTFCMFVLLCCTLFLVCLVCSLFWEIIKVTVVKRTLKFRVAKVTILMIILLIASLYAGCAKPNYGVLGFLESCVVVSWFAAFVLAVLGSIGLLAFCYREQSHELYAVALLPMCAAFVLFSILSPVSFTLVGASKAAVCFSFFYPFSTACLTLYVCFRGCRRPNGEYFIIKKRFAFLFVIAYIGVIVLTLTSRPHSDGKDSCFPSLNNHTRMSNDFGSKAERGSRRYPICGNTWTPSRLNIADIAYLSSVAYQDNLTKKDVNQSVNTYFSNRGIQWNVTYISQKNLTFYHVFEATERVHVISIRGSQSTGDWIKSLKLWSEIISYQITAVALPVQTLPLSFVTSFVTAASFLERVMHHNREDFAFSSLESYLSKHLINRTVDRDINIILTGHSLTGGLAKILGSRLKIPVVSFSSPGELHIHGKMGFTLDDLQRYTTSVVSRNDVVTWIDRHGGLVQYIGCSAQRNVPCHSIVNIYCELKEGCGFDSPIKC